QKSSDRGLTWSGSNVGLPFDASVNAFAVAPQTPSTLYAGTESGVFKSLDGGSTWGVTGSTPLRIRSLAIDPQTSATIYAGPFIDGLYKCGGAGASWAAANNGLSMFFVRAIAIDPVTPATVYVGGNNLFAGSGVSKSTDAGGSWSDVSSGLTDLFVSALAIDPQNPATLAAGAE